MQSFSISTVAPEARFESWRDMISRQFLPLSPQLRGPMPFDGHLHGDRLGEFGLATVRASGQRVLRGRREISAREVDGLFLNVHVAGAGGFEAREICRKLTPGDVFLVDGSHPFELNCEQPIGQVCIGMPGHFWRAKGVRIELAAGSVLSHADPVVTLLADYTVSLARVTSQAGAGTPDFVLTHVVDLLAYLLDRQRRDAPLPRMAVRDALHRRACGFIERNLGDSALAPAQVARHLGVSLRYLHALFGERDSSVMRYVMERRLEAAARVLADPGHIERRITEIAFNLGFQELSHFSRVFTVRYGAPPSEFRRRSIRED